LANNGPFTIFAPTNAAFENLPDGTVENLLKPENKDALTRVLYYHASPGTYKKPIMRDGMNIFQATGDNVKIAVKDQKYTVNGATIHGSVNATNGVVHVIDAVLLPPEK
jgi:uncharacterized surface protein with fasciclin (FAS1) repeats